MQPATWTWRGVGYQDGATHGIACQSWQPRLAHIPLLSLQAERQEAKKEAVPFAGGLLKLF